MIRHTNWYIGLLLVGALFLGLGSVADAKPQIDFARGGLMVDGSIHRMECEGPCLHRIYHSQNRRTGLFGLGWQSHFELMVRPDVDGSLWVWRPDVKGQGDLWTQVPPVGGGKGDFVGEVRKLAWGLLRSAAVNASLRPTNSQIERKVKELTDQGPLRLEMVRRGEQEGWYAVPGLEQITAWRGGGIRVTRQEGGFLVETINQLFEFDSSGRLAASNMFGDSLKWRLHYDESGRIARVTCDNRPDLIFSYRPQGDVVESLQYGDKVVWQGLYDKDGLLRQETRANGRSKRYFYDVGKRIFHWRDDNESYSCSYDLQGRLTRIRLEGQTFAEITCALHGATFTLDLRLPEGLSDTQKADFFDAAIPAAQAKTETPAQPTRVCYETIVETNAGFPFIAHQIRNDGVDVESWGYDRNGLQTQRGKNGKFQFRSYDESGRPVELIDFTGEKLRVSYTECWNRLAMVQTASWTANYTFVGKNQLLRRAERTDLGAIELFYNSKDKIIRMKKGDGTRLDYVYDAQDRVARIMQGQGRTVWISYAEDDELTTTQSDVPNGTSFAQETIGVLNTLLEINSAAKVFWARFLDLPLKDVTH